MQRVLIFAAFLLLTLFLAVSVSFNFLLASSHARNLSGGLANLLGQEDQPRFQETIFRGSPDEEADRIAMISIDGVISESEPGVISENMVFDTLHAFRQAGGDDRVKAIVLRIDSPGGEITASDTLYSELRELRAKKPVVVSMGASAASGAYYLACGSSYIVANPSTTTGSIGVIISVINYKDLLGKIGLKSLVFKSGFYKDILSGARDMTQPEHDYMEIMVMQAYERFATVVSQERKIPEMTLKEQVGDGRIISGRDALGFKLIDKTGNLEDAIDQAAQMANLESPTVVHYTASHSLSRFLPALSATARDQQVQLQVDLLPKLQLEAGKVYLLPEIFAP